MCLGVYGEVCIHMSEKQVEGHTPFHHIGPQNEIQVSGLMATSFSFRAIPGALDCLKKKHAGALY